MLVVMATVVPAAIALPFVSVTRTFKLMALGAAGEAGLTGRLTETVFPGANVVAGGAATKTSAPEVDMMSSCSTPIASVASLQDDDVHVMPTNLPLGPSFTPLL